MNILAISGDFSIGDMCEHLQKEGHSVKVYIEDEYYTKSLMGRFEKVAHWRNELEWVGEDGLIIFDSTGYGAVQDKLRAEGYSVIGGCELGDKCEDDREFGQRTLALAGIKTLPSKHFETIDEAIEYIRHNPDEWVIKHDGHSSMTFTYIGELKDGRDSIEMLKTFKCKNPTSSFGTILLQERVRGVEIGIARYFNGTDWVGPIELNIEHKDLDAGNIGPKTWEMGTLMWFDTNENNKLFNETLAKIKPYLAQIGFRGDVDINCIVNEDGVHPLEWTARLGFPALQLQSVLAERPFGEFLKAVADGKQHDMNFHKGYGVTVLVAVPPFPYGVSLGEESLQGSPIILKEELTEDEKERIHYEDVYLDTEDNIYRIAGENGFVMHVSGKGNTVGEARENAYSLIKKICVPKMFYRTDIGLSFAEDDQKKLIEWGWL